MGIGEFTHRGCIQSLTFAMKKAKPFFCTPLIQKNINLKNKKKNLTNNEKYLS